MYLYFLFFFFVICSERICGTSDMYNKLLQQAGSSPLSLSLTSVSAGLVYGLIFWWVWQSFRKCSTITDGVLQRHSDKNCSTITADVLQRHSDKNCSTITADVVQRHSDKNCSTIICEVLQRHSDKKMFHHHSWCTAETQWQKLFHHHVMYCRGTVTKTVPPSREVLQRHSDKNCSTITADVVQRHSDKNCSTITWCTAEAPWQKKFHHHVMKCRGIVTKSVPPSRDEVQRHSDKKCSSTSTITCDALQRHTDNSQHKIWKHKLPKLWM